MGALARSPGPVAASVTVGAIIDRTYARFLDGWLTSVLGLTTQPCEVVLVTDITDVPDWVRVVAPPGPFEWATWHNRLVEATATEYLSWVNADDRYLPHALDHVDVWAADVVGFDCVVTGNKRRADGSWPVFRSGAQSARDVLAAMTNIVPCGSPFRVDVWDRVGGFDPHMMPFADWAFWSAAAIHGATFQVLGQDPQFAYRWHPDTPMGTERYRRKMRDYRARVKEGHRWLGPVSSF